MAGWLRGRFAGVMLFVAFSMAGLVWPAGEMVEHS